jgi:Caspase domain
VNVRAADSARSRIVLFGTPAYVDKDLPDVPVVANNVADLAAVLTDPDLGGFDPAHCVIVPADADEEKVGDLLMQAAAEAEDLLLFYYSGHAKPERREFYLCLARTKPDRLRFTALRFDDVREAFLGSPARNRVIILDSCYSGRAIGETLGDDDMLHQLEVSGTYTLTSASANREALYLPGELHTAFTERLLHLLYTGLPEAGELLSLGDIYRELNRRLRAEGLPAPQCCGTQTAESLALARNLLYIPTAAEAAAIREVTSGRAAVPTEAAGDWSPAGRLRQRAAAALKVAERSAQTIPKESRKAPALASIAQALAVTDPDRAIDIAQSITDGYQQAHALARIAQALAVIDPDRAVDIAQGITDASVKAQALAGVARALATTDPEWTSRLWKEAEDTALTIAFEHQKAQALARIVMALAPVGPDRAMDIAQSITDRYQQAHALASIAQALAVTDPDRAVDIAQSITDPNQKALALAALAQAAAADDPERTGRLWSEAEYTAQTIAHPQQKAQTLARIVILLAPFDPDRAEHTAQIITDAAVKAQALAGIAQALAVTDPDRAERIAHGIAHGHQRALALAGVAQAVGPTNPARAIRLAEEAEGIAGSITNELSKAQALAGIAQALAGTSRDRAEHIARNITDESSRAQALAAIARVWLGEG